MASGLYENGKRERAKGNINLESGEISAILIDSSAYSVDLDNDEDLSDIGEANIIAEAALTGKTLDGTTFRADDVTFPSVETGQTVSAVVIFLNEDTLEDSTLIAYLDNAPEMPITTDGTDIIISWDTGANGIFKV